MPSPWALQLCLFHLGELLIPQEGPSSWEPKASLSFSKEKLRPPHPHQPLPRLQTQDMVPLCPCHLLQWVPQWALHRLS